jgi:drug/metabolite transporter (DMT)-like permease
MPGLDSVFGISSGVWLALGSMLIFSACTLLSSVAARKLDTDSGALLAVAVTVPLGLVLALVQFVAGRQFTAPTAWGIGAFVVAGIFSTYLGRWLFFKSVETIGPTRSAAFLTCSPLATAFFGWIFLGEHISASGLTGMAVAVGGLLIMSLGRVTRPGAAAAGSQTAATLSLAIGAGSTIAYAVSHVFRGSAVREWNEPVVGATLGAAAGAIVLAYVSRYQFALIRRRIAQQPASAWMYCGIGSMQLVAQVLMIASMTYIPISISTLIATCTPLVVMPVSVIFMRNAEQVRTGTALGVIVTVAGVLLAVYSGAR